MKLVRVSIGVVLLVLLGLSVH